MTAADAPATLQRSRHLSVFAHMGDIYVFHDLFGYILQMSPDLLGLLDQFAEPADVAAVCTFRANSFDGQDPRGFVDVFTQFACLVESEAEELEEMWDKVPVAGKWNVWARDAEGNISIYTAWGDAPIRRHRLGADETAIWDAIDGETPMRKLAETYGRFAVGELVRTLVHHDVQALKLSNVPISFFKGRLDLQPAYLSSTMPYARHRPETDAPVEPRGSEVSPVDYYREEVSDAEAQFDHQETTLSHLLRRPHPALGGKTYGRRLIETLLERQEHIAETIRLLEIGGGLGFVAEAIIEVLRERNIEIVYHIAELAPALAAAQRERCGDSIEIIEGNVLEVAIEGTYDLVLANEMIGDLPAVELTLAQVGIDPRSEGDERAALLSELADAGRIIGEYELPLEDAPDPFYLTTGAVQLIERLQALLAPEGLAVLTEFGNLSQYPRLSTQLDHPELSIHFGHLMTVAKKIGLSAKFEFVIDLLDMDRTLEGMATTRSYFRALCAMLSERGVTLEKIGYTRALFDQLLAQASVDPDSLGDIRFDKIEDRLMGLVPHEFKALLLGRPTGE